MINNLSKTYSSGVKALNNVSLKIGTGMFGLLGPNGAGKSTLMRMLATLQEADSGSAALGQIDMLKQKTEVKKVIEQNANTVKLENVVPPIQFKSGEADIPENYVELLRGILDSMKTKVNVRLHFVGHTDSAKLSGALKEKYIATGECSEEDIATYVKGAKDPRSLATYYATMSIVGIKA